LLLLHAHKEKSRPISMPQCGGGAWLRNHVVRCRKALLLLPECPLLLTHHTTQTTQQKKPCTEFDDKHERNMLLADGLLRVLQGHLQQQASPSCNATHKHISATTTLLTHTHHLHNPTQPASFSFSLSLSQLPGSCPPPAPSPTQHHR